MPFLLFSSLPFHLLKKALDLDDFAEHPPYVWHRGGYLAVIWRVFGGSRAVIPPLRSVTMSTGPGQGRWDISECAQERWKHPRVSGPHLVVLPQQLQMAMLQDGDGPASAMLPCRN
jgi:hypothetical protein